MKTVVAIVSTCLVTAALIAAPQDTEEFSGKVISVTDGDTIKVLVNRKPVTIRLEGIDAPESKQSFGARSKQALSRMVFGKTVVVKKTGEDRYGRTLGTIMLGRTDINAKMIEDGWAWHFKKYNKEEWLAKLELEARKAKRGLWAAPNPLAPWDYRTRKRTADDPPATMFWLNTSSNVRHNQNCEYFKNTKRGRICGPNDGKRCGICGG
ncbi:thermonuclease family protein [Rubripirellula sp.]|nr:thermonuclease family protein [Rubripirellula sp.]